MIQDTSHKSFQAEKHELWTGLTKIPPVRQRIMEWFDPHVWNVFIFPDQGWNPCPLHQQADYLPLDHQGSPVISYLNECFNLQEKKHI